jgi:glutamate carboxypeptidase
VQVDPALSRGTAAGKTNVVAERVTVLGDIRALTKQQFAAAQDTMQQIAKQWLPHTVAELTFDEGYPPLPPSVGNEQLLVIYNQASEDLGFGRVTAVNPDRAGAADVSFIAGVVPMIIDAVGLKGRDDHTPAETADLTTLARQAKRAALLIARLPRQ